MHAFYAENYTDPSLAVKAAISKSVIRRRCVALIHGRLRQELAQILETRAVEISQDGPATIYTGFDEQDRKWTVELYDR